MNRGSITLVILLIISIILNIYFATQLFKFKKLYHHAVHSVQTKFEDLGDKANKIDNKIKSYVKNNTNEVR